MFLFLVACANPIYGMAEGRECSYLPVHVTRIIYCERHDKCIGCDWTDVMSYMYPTKWPAK